MSGKGDVTSILFNLTVPNLKQGGVVRLVRIVIRQISVIPDGHRQLFFQRIYINGIPQYMAVDGNQEGCPARIETLHEHRSAETHQCIPSLGEIVDCLCLCPRCTCRLSAVYVFYQSISRQFQTCKLIKHLL